MCYADLIYESDGKGGHKFSHYHITWPKTYEEGYADGLHDAELKHVK